MSGGISYSAFITPRLVLNKFLAKSQREGVGAIVRRGIGRYIYEYICILFKLELNVAFCIHLI
jgi:hypothetical protein